MKRSEIVECLQFAFDAAKQALTTHKQCIELSECYRADTYDQVTDQAAKEYAIRLVIAKSPEREDYIKSTIVPTLFADI